MKRKWLYIIGILIIIVAVVFLNFQKAMKDYDKKINNMVISDVDLTKIADGTYEGKCEIYPITVEVKVSIEDHKIVSIDLVKHVNGKGAKAEVITDRVIEKQSLNVDTIAGATGSSKVILKAIENALNSDSK
jgi:uncharacterized protein with FMN-binding domain